MKTDNPTNTTLATLPARLRRTFLAQDQQTRALLERLPSDKLEQVLACYKETPWAGAAARQPPLAISQGLTATLGDGEYYPTLTTLKW